MDREVMKLALEALVAAYQGKDKTGQVTEAITALRERLAQPEQEPVAWANSSDLQNFDMRVRTGPDLHHTVPLYTAPPKKQWVGLTDREVELIDEMIETQLLHAERCDHMANSTMAQKQKAWDLERVELLRKLKEKNT